MSCTEKNPLTREGTSLLTRALAALSPGYARVDERAPEDLILFAKRYATRLNFFRDDNTVDGDWQKLMASDISVPLAALSRIDIQEITDYKKRLYKKILLSASEADAMMEFKFLFDLIFSVSKAVDQQFQLLPADFEYRKILSDVIIKKLRLPLANLVSNFNSFKTAGLLDYTTLQLDNDAPLSVVSNEIFEIATDMGATWQGAVADISLTIPSLPSKREVIVYITRHNLFNAQIELLFNGISSVALRATDLFTETLADYPGHAPHYALFLTFIKLFAHAQDGLNQYTQRHLDFYYKEVLQLVNRAPQPDTAHVVFELQKPVDQERLTKNSLFKGGKDITGKEISYALLDDIVINKASVTKIQSTQIIRGTKDMLMASLVANSDDGQGAKISSADQSWFTFGDSEKIQAAQTGFAIASNLLYLNEGNRTIQVAVHFNNAIPSVAFCNLNCFTARFTGKKKWEPVNIVSVSAAAGWSSLNFTIRLSPDDPSVVPYSEKIHKQNMALIIPVLEIYLDQSVVSGIPYTLVCNQEISNVDLTVSVTGIKDLVLSNDNGTLDAAKPFKPFGDFPDTGSGFYLGSKELFQKSLTRVVVNTGWKASVPAMKTDAHYLWQNSFDSKRYTASIGPSSISIDFSGVNSPFIPAVMDFTSNEKITADSLEGFMRIQLNEHSYSLDQHLKDISTALSNGSALKWDSVSNSYKISIAPTPVALEAIMNKLSVDYTASTSISFTAGAPDDNHLFFHLCPFGFSRVSQSLVDDSPRAEKTKKITLLQDIPNEGELFVGLAGARAEMVVTILFEVAEGSSNPLLDIEQLGWFYLSADNWKSFPTENLIDNSNNFSQSGVVTLTLPADSTTGNTLLQSGMVWIKTTAHPFTDAVCKMILIQAQAAQVRLIQDDSKSLEYHQVLPAGTISKLVVSDAAIKKIQQPFDSFNGRIRETDDHFYVRVSERLRHKQRAISIWDYEHIVLEQFPKIFKVKCINHAGFYSEKGKDVFCENYPGHVTVVTIPDQTHNSNINPLRPYTPIGMLNNIYEYLETINSPFVKLHVKVPQFEEIQLDFKVSFYEHLDPSFYTGLLNLEIEKFLCPWAYDNKVEISFGGSIAKSALINFIEERSYVDFVTCFKMYHFTDRSQAPVDVDLATGSTARSILVSYYDEVNNIRHKIVSPANCTCR